MLTFAINPSSGELQEDDSPNVSLPAHIGAVRSLSVSSSANHLISGGDESMVLVWSYGGQKRDEASLEVCSMIFWKDSSTKIILYLVAVIGGKFLVESGEKRTGNNYLISSLYIYSYFRSGSISFSDSSFSSV